MLKSLPTSNETPGLLDDITYVGTSAGLTFRLLNWQQEIPKEFYTELPIEVEVKGSYHEFGSFVSSIAGLPRIVTLHDFELISEEDVQTTLLAEVVCIGTHAEFNGLRPWHRPQMYNMFSHMFYILIRISMQSWMVCSLLDGLQSAFVAELLALEWCLKEFRLL